MADEKRQRRVRRSFTDDFKAGAIRLVLDEGKTVMQVARDLDLTASALRQWVERARADRSKGKTGLTTEERAELARLRKENRSLRMERDILKKAAVGSAGRCNSTGDSSSWRQEAKCLAWPAIQPQSDHVEVVLAVR
jgi:transposase